MNQTEAQHPQSIRLKSAKVEVGPDVDNLIDIGLASSIEFKELFTPVVFKPRNAPEIQVGTQDHTVSVKFDLWEIHLKRLSLLRGGMDSLTYSSLKPVSIVQEPCTLNGTTPTRLLNRNGDDTLTTISRVASGIALFGTSSGQILLTADMKVFEIVKGIGVQDVDFLVTLDSGGYTRLARVAGSAILEDGKPAFIDYTYTPVANVRMSSGGLESISSRVVRLTNLNSAGKKIQITIYSAKNQSGIELKLLGDDEGKAATIPIELKGVRDETRTDFDQLFDIIDEQGV